MAWQAARLDFYTMKMSFGELPIHLPMAKRETWRGRIVVFFLHAFPLSSGHIVSLLDLERLP